MVTTKRYPALFFRQRPDAQVQVAFAAVSSEIDDWARVPAKSTGNMRNFQRAQIPRHVQEVESYFRQSRNTSPTAVVVGFDPIRARGRVRLLNDNGDPIGAADIRAGEELRGEIEISWDPDDDPATAADVLGSIVSHQDMLRATVYRELTDITQLDESTLATIEKHFIDEGGPSDIPDLESDESDDEEDASQGDVEIPAELRTLLGGLSPSEQQMVVGRLAFVASAHPSNLKGLPESQLRELLQHVRSELKPGLLIDGQHRVLGTRKLGKIPFLVMALPFADWPELAFQFIVTNRTARRVPESLLISIVGNSLSRRQRADIEERLRDANIRVGLIEAVMRVHEDELSPFYNMVAFGLKNEDGFLDAAAMRGKVIQPWYERLSPVLHLFDHFCQGKKKGERTDFWKSEDLWFDFFTAFWSAVRDRYEGTNVFSDEQVQDAKGKEIPASALMRATVLMIFQNTILDNILDHLKQKSTKDGIPISESIPDSRKFGELVKNSLQPLTPDFFEGWKISGFDGSKGARDDLVSALELVLTGRKSVAKLKSAKGAHRLFVESER